MDNAGDMPKSALRAQAKETRLRLGSPAGRVQPRVVVFSHRNPSPQRARDVARSAEERPFQGPRSQWHPIGRPLGPVAPLGLKPNVSDRRAYAALKSAALPRRRQGLYSDNKSPLIQRPNRTILHFLFPARRRCRFSKAGSGARFAKVPTCARPGFCFHERDAEIRGSSRLPTVRESYLPEGDLTGSQRSCRLANLYEYRLLPERVLQPKPT